MVNKQLTSIIFFTLISITFTLSGQKQVNSPFARFNLGIFEPAGSFRSTGMGGVGTAFRDNSSIYFSNPASYSSLDTNSFIFDFGIDYGINNLYDGNLKHFSDDFNFDHLLMGFPLAKGWGFATGVHNMSSGYFKISNLIVEGDPDYDPVTGEYTEYHAGDGGLTNFFFGTGLKITKNFSAGINMSVLFGTIKRLNEYNFVDYYHTFQTNKTDRIQLTGINFDYGLQYNTSLKKNYFFNAGISLSTGRDCKSRYENILFSYNAYSAIDTLEYTRDDATRAYLPGTLRLGVAFGKKDKFSVGTDYITTNWSEAKFPGSEGFVGDTRELLVGAEYIPEKYSNYSFIKRLEYRIGGHIRDNYLVINNEQVKEYGVSFGLGIPMRRTQSKTNFFFDFTKKSLESGPVSHYENYITMGLSLNMYDYWFRKRKYD